MPSESLDAPVIIIPTWDGLPQLQQCLGSLPAVAHQHVIVVDNGSTDGTADWVRREHPEVSLLCMPENLGFAPAVNRALVAAHDRDVILLNNDVVVDHDWWDELRASARTAPAEVGFISSKILRVSDGRIDSAGDAQTWSGVPTQRGHGQVDVGQFDGEAEIFSACGGASWFRRRMLDDVGLLEESFFAYYEDVDLCSRAQLRGWTGRLAPRAVVRHDVSATSTRTPGFKRMQSTRNCWWLILRTIPTPLLSRVLACFVAHQMLLFGQAVATGEIRACLRGHLAGLSGIPRALKQRAVIQATVAIDVDAFAGKLAPPRFAGIIRQGMDSLLNRAFKVRSVAPYNADAALRYDPIVQLIAGRSGRLLEVGSGRAGVTEHGDVGFAVGCDLDFDATQHLHSDTLHLVRGSGVNLPFRDQTFDTTISVDALEHVPRPLRPPFVRELMRVTRGGGLVVLAAPMGRWAATGDAVINWFYRRQTGREHPWLAEHIREGLPLPWEVDASVQLATPRQVVVHRNAWLPLWLLLQRVTFAAHNLRSVEMLLGRLSQRLRWAPCYRRIYEIHV